MSANDTLLLNSIDTSLRYAYVLINQNPRRGGVFDENGRAVQEQEFKTLLNVLFESSIVWPGGIDPFTIDENGKNGKHRPSGKYYIRYYDGCTTLFKDSQPNDKPTIDALNLSTGSRYFNNGYLFVEGYEKLFKVFMDWTSMNELSPYRDMKIFPKFKSVLPERSLVSEGDLLDLEDKATDIAKSAPVSKMISHANFLEIPMEDNVTGVKFSPEVLRIAYRKKAKENPSLFISSYSDETMELKYKIKKLIIEGKLSTSLLPNSLTWVSNGKFIVDISGLESIDNIVKKAAEYSQTDDGAEFLDKLKSA
jgi:hypothetical protein